MDSISLLTRFLKLGSCAMSFAEPTVTVAVSSTAAMATAALTWWRGGFLGSLEILGNGSSDVSINFWLRAFPVGAADFTVLLLSGMFYALLMVPVCAFMWLQAVRRDNTASSSATTSITAKTLLKSLFCNKTNIMWMCLVTLCDLSINIFGTYAAGHIPVMLQVILKSAEPFLCWLLSCLVWRGEYTQKSFLLVALPTVAMFMAAGAVVAETWIALQAASEKTNVAFWVSIFGLRVLSSAAYNVSQGTLMRRNRLVFGTRCVDNASKADSSSLSTTEVSSLLDAESASNRLAAPSVQEGRNKENRSKGKDHMLLLSTTILAVDATLSLIFLLAFGPLIDTVTYGEWGFSNSVGDAWANFSSGAQCVFSNPFHGECPNNLWLALLTNGAWVVVYVVDTFLNEVSPALNSLLNMLSSPLTTIFLVIFPALDLGATLHRDSKTILLQCLGIVLMCISVGLFVHYERCKSKVMKKMMDDKCRSDSAEGDSVAADGDTVLREGSLN
ncbi:transmembrane protein, putative [Bodo saltans]|uniref:Transmembrane protein, putative n=1 Tax=Bodo saltans TaxID=75058 RepID=A0A0S4ILP9_BODSA|nr:transmembrane protein, putative [Bodo saltans]|eukprot:CUE71796.1 transmembrane protein, putative [Bodo saltans]